MIDAIKEATQSRWFQNQSPFRNFLHLHHTKLCLIIGPNASGKSLLRKLIHNFYIDHEIGLITLSQSARCQSGIERAVIYGSEADDSTGYNSVNALCGVSRTVHKREKPVGILIDEPEIGCSEETQAAIGCYIRDYIVPANNLHSLYIITHSRHVVKMLLPLNPSWCSMEVDTTLESWLDREIIPTNLETMKEKSQERWRFIEKNKR